MQEPRIYFPPCGVTGDHAGRLDLHSYLATMRWPSTQLPNGRKYLQISYSIKDLYLIYTKNPQNLTVKKQRIPSEKWAKNPYTRH